MGHTSPRHFAEGEKGAIKASGGPSHRQKKARNAHHFVSSHRETKCSSPTWPKNCSSLGRGLPDLVGVAISLVTLATLQQATVRAVAARVAEARASVQEQPVASLDERVARRAGTGLTYVSGSRRTCFATLGTPALSTTKSM